MIYCASAAVQTESRVFTPLYCLSASPRDVFMTKAGRQTCQGQHGHGCISLPLSIMSIGGG